MKKPEIKKENVKTLLDTKFVKVFDLQYAEGKHYYDATRRELDQLTALKSDGEFRAMEPDAATCIVILKTPGEEPRLLLSYEYRYPVGQFLLSPPAGLIDPADRGREDALLRTAIREIREETGIEAGENARVFVVDPLVFSTPGMTDESNGLVCAVVEQPDLSALSQAGAEGTECFDGFCLPDRQQALALLRTGRDNAGRFYSAYTWIALMYFVSGLWEEEI